MCEVGAGAQWTGRRRHELLDLAATPTRAALLKNRDRLPQAVPSSSYSGVTYKHYSALDSPTVWSCRCLERLLSNQAAADQRAQRGANRCFVVTFRCL